jgi:predicted dehydrogenase
VQFGTDPQEAKAIAAPCQPASDPDYGREDEHIWGTLSTAKEFDTKSQIFDEESRLYIGKYPSMLGRYRGLYENVVAAIRGTAELYVKPETSRDGLRILELARESHDTGRVVLWS